MKDLSPDDKYKNFFKAYKRIIFIDEISKDKISFNAFLIDIKTIPNFIKLIEELILNKKNINDEIILKNAFKNYILEKQIKIFYLFEECENIIKQNLEKENSFIIVDKLFLKYMNLNINDENKRYVVINIDKDKSLYCINFPISNKKINFIELKPGIYKFDENKINMNKTLILNRFNPLIEKIKSKYIINNITSYINDENYLLKLIEHSKCIQKNLDINLLNYQEKYINERIHYEDFLSDINLYEKNLNNLKNILLTNQYNKDNINKFAINYFINYYNNLDNKEDSLYEFSKDIEFSSPFFDILLNTGFFNKIFNILISSKKIKDYNLKNRYKSKFEKLNKSNIEYYSITLYIDNEDDINILKDFNINFKQLKKLKLLKDKDADIYNFENHDFTKIINSFNIQNNLVYFEYELSSSYNKINPNQFEIINNFKSLEYFFLLLNFQQNLNLN